MSSITTSAIDTPARRSVERTCDDLAIVVLGAVALIASLTFRDYGLGWDDYTHAEYADLLLRMYGSGFKDTGALSFANLYMYGGGFDMAAALLHKIIPLELFETRRLLGAVVGVIGLAVTWRLGRRVGGPLAGLAALLMLALCPTFYGHMFMNPKDAPFAVVMGLIWPWSIMEPANPFHALTYFSHFFEKPWKEMFDGALVSVPDMPWSYLPTLFALQLPEVLLGLAI